MTIGPDIPYCPRETIASFVSRTAAYFGVNAATFAADKEISFLKLIEGSSEAVQTLLNFNVSLPEGVIAWSPTSDGMVKRNRLFRQHIFPSMALQKSEMRGCPACLRDDLEGPRNPELSMAMRGHWLVPHVTLCLKHQLPLVTLWQESKPIARFDSAICLAEIAQNIVARELDEEMRDETDFDVWLDRRLEGHADGNWLEQFSLHAACNYSLMLGKSLLRHEMTAPSSVAPEDRWAVYQMGFKIARHGEGAIRDALLRLQRLPGGPHDGPKKIFPKMYERLAYDYIDNPDYDVFRHVLRSHMLETWPLSVGDELMGEAVTERKLHSVRTAALATGVDQRRLRKVLVSEGIVPERGLPDAWEVFDAKLAKDVLRSATTLVSAKAFAQSIGATRSQFDLLVSGGAISPRLLSVDNAGTKAIWDPGDGVRFLESLFLGATPLRQAQHGWTHISKSAMRLMVGPESIIRAIHEKRIVRIGNHADYDGYAALYVYHDEVRSILSPEPSTNQSIELFSRAVGIGQPSRMRRLILNGYTPATKMLNPKLKTQQLYVTREDANAFHRMFYTPRTMAQAHGRSWQSMTAALHAKGIQAFSPDGEDYGSLYKRDLVDAIFK